MMRWVRNCLDHHTQSQSAAQSPSDSQWTLLAPLKGQYPVMPLITSWNGVAKLTDSKLMHNTKSGVVSDMLREQCYHLEESK